MGGSLRWGSFSAHMDSCAGDAMCLHGDLLFSLSLRDLSHCLDEELCEPLLWDPGHSFEGREHLWHEDFLPGQPVALGGSPFLLVELGTSPELRGGSPFLLVELGASPELRESWDVSSL